MTIYERLETLKDTTEFEIANAHDLYNKKETELVGLVGEYLIGNEATCPAYGTGKVVGYEGANLNDLAVVIEFAEVIKKYSVQFICTATVKFVRFTDIFEIGDVWDAAVAVHIILKAKYNELGRLAYQKALEAEKKAKADKKAEEQYQKTKAKSIRDFEELTQTVNPKSEADEFYYSLGWLAKHMGAITAILPDYLGAAFEQHFGVDTPKTLVDGRAKTSGGYAKQWSWEFKSTIKKLKETTVPAYIQDITTDFSKGIHNTSFIWDLVENYGFQFGKTQDIEKIKACVPAKYASFFEAGFAA